MEHSTCKEINKVNRSFAGKLANKLMQGCFRRILSKIIQMPEIFQIDFIVSPDLSNTGTLTLIC